MHSIPLNHLLTALALSPPPPRHGAINGGRADSSERERERGVPVCGPSPFQLVGLNPEKKNAMETASDKKVAMAGEGGAAEGGVDHGVVKTAETVLRVMPMGLCLAAMGVMLTNTQSSGDYGSVSYADLSGFKYLVYADGVCAAYSLLSAFYTAATSRRPSTLRPAWTLFLLDQVLTYVVLAAGAVAAEIIYLARNGDDEVTWSRVCGMFGGFCHRATASAGATFGAAACYVGLSLLSSYRLFSAYSAPIPFLSKGVEVAALPFSG